MSRDPFGTFTSHKPILECLLIESKIKGGESMREVKIGCGKPTLKPGPDLVGKVWEVWKVEHAFD